MIGFRACGNCMELGGLVGTPLKRRYVPDKTIGYCSVCKSEYYLPESEVGLGDGCPCGSGKIKQKKRLVEYCPKCEAMKEESK